MKQKRIGLLELQKGSFCLSGSFLNEPLNWDSTRVTGCHQDILSWTSMSISIHCKILFNFFRSQNTNYKSHWDGEYHLNHLCDHHPKKSDLSASKVTMLPNAYGQGSDRLHCSSPTKPPCTNPSVLLDWATSLQKVTHQGSIETPFWVFCSYEPIDLCWLYYAELLFCLSRAELRKRSTSGWGERGAVP